RELRRRQADAPCAQRAPHRQCVRQQRRLRMSRSSQRFPCAMARGFSLIEVMVAVLVLSLGLLGLAALQGLSMRNNQSANYRTQATNLAYEFIDTARGYADRNQQNLLAFVEPFGKWTATCAAGAET